MKQQGNNMLTIKKLNRALLLRLLHRNESLSRKQLSENMKLSPAAISMIVSEMLDEGLLVSGKARSRKGTVGRKEIPLFIRGDYYISLGISINIGELIFSATDLKGKILYASNKTIPNNVDSEYLLSCIEEEFKSFVEEQKISTDRLIGAGIIVRGIVNQDTQVSVDSFGCIREKNIPLGEMLSERLGIFTCIDNNVRGILRAHRFYYNDTSSNAFLVRCEKGIGAAVMIDGNIINGANGMCSEFGHIPTCEISDKPCKCGGFSCLELIASPSAIVEKVSEAMKTNNSKEFDKLSNIIEYAQKGNKTIIDIIENAAKHLAIGIKGVVLTLDPKQVVLYGSLFTHKYYIDRLFHYINEDFDNRLEVTDIFVSPYNMQFEQSAASVLCIERFFDNGGFILKSMSHEATQIGMKTDEKSSVFSCRI